MDGCSLCGWKLCLQLNGNGIRLLDYFSVHIRLIVVVVLLLLLAGHFAAVH